MILDCVTDCGGTWTEPSGIIESPNYPGQYDNRGNCAYYLKVPGATDIIFYFKYFDSEIFKDVLEYGTGEETSTALSDIVMSWEGNLTRLGSISESDTYSVGGDTAWFAWTTDRNIVQNGFQIVYAAGK